MNIVELHNDFLANLKRIVEDHHIGDHYDEIVEFVEDHADINPDNFDEEDKKIDLGDDAADFISFAIQCVWGALDESFNALSKKGEPIVVGVTDALCDHYNVDSGDIDPSYFSGY